MIVNAVPSDAKTLTQIALESKAYWGYSSEQIESWKSDLTILPETFKDWRGCKFMMDTEIAGFYILNRVNSRTCFLEFLFVKPKFIGKNIGGQLVEHAITNCRTNSCEVLNVLSDPNAASFYEKYGFKTISLKESSVPGRFLPEMEIEFPENM
ncbi:GNAT family N-acetyltransferase [Polaribacter uvawellassae]|uniref:GNAT family N-acetyltransferase n=1 Tax=Polaribacter uvawellassae TaxID=3133495 RepID=UPI00321A6DC4